MNMIIVVGGAGALGRALISYIYQHAPETFLLSVDIASRSIEGATRSFQLSGNHQDDFEEIRKIATGNTVKAVYCTAGGWAGGSITASDLMEVSRKMYNVNVEPALLAAKLSAALKVRLSVFVGAKAALHGTPQMIAYGMAKASLIQLVNSLNDKKDGSELAGKAVLLLPEILDTAANRAAMPDSDTSGWTPLHVIAKFMYDLQDHDLQNTMFTIRTRAGQTHFETVTSQQQ